MCPSGIESSLPRLPNLATEFDLPIADNYAVDLLRKYLFDPSIATISRIIY